MNKETVLIDTELKLTILEVQIECIKKIELNTLYKVKDEIYGLNPFDTYGYFECFNRDSARFVIIASNNPEYHDYDKSSQGYSFRKFIEAMPFIILSNVVMKGTCTVDAKITPLSDRLSPVAEDELPLMVGMKYKSPDFEKVLKGKKKLKYWEKP
jgi:hypothetical protein